MTIKSSRPSTTWLIALTAVLLLTANMVSQAAVTGQIIKRSGKPLNGDITWYAASQAYGLEMGVTSLSIPLADVLSVRVAKPDRFDRAVQMVRSGRHAAAVSPLKKIVDDYEMLRWDIQAARWLAEAYLNLNQAGKAVDMCEKIIRGNPEAERSGELARIYWDALEKDGKTATLTRVLSDAIQEGSREVAAVAQIKRADIQRSRKKIEDALKDGYLRTAILYQDIKRVQPEALLKATECFRELGQTTYAEKMRKRLLDNYPRSPEAQRVRSGA